MDRMDEPVTAHMRTDLLLLHEGQTIAEALEVIRREGVGERIIYFYVVDEEKRLAGVLPTRRLLMSPIENRLGDVMISRVVALPHTATVCDACEFFVLHRFLALPVVDDEKHVLGVVDVTLFADEIFSLTERKHSDDIFEVIGFRYSEVRNAKPIQAFRYRFPWLLATVASGTVCALMAGAFGATLAQTLVIAFFLTLVLGLGESVSVQSMTVTIQALNVTRPTLKWYLRTLRKEMLSALLLGAACSLMVFAIVWVWQKDFWPAFVIGSSISCALVAASLLGISIPAIFHALALDPKIAAGPITLAIADICTLLFYFGLASALL